MERGPGDRDDERYRVGRVRRVGVRAVALEHLLGVAVVGRDETGAAELLDLRHQAPETGVDGLDRTHDRRNDPRVTDHVGIREVHDREAVAVADRLFELPLDLRR